MPSSHGISPMTQDERLAETQRLLRKCGWDAEAAMEVVQDAIEKGEPILESLCFYMLAEHILAAIHTDSWITNRGANPDRDGHDVIKRLLDTGASAEDLAIFARIMQREYLSSLGCILDGVGIAGTPSIPFENFRIFSVDELDRPQASLENLHSWLAWTDLETEMRLSREAEKEFDRHASRGE